MKQFCAAIMAFILVLFFTGCSQKKQPDPNIPVSKPVVPSGSEITEQPFPAEPAPKPAVAVSLPATTTEYTADDGTQIFYHTAQTMHLTIADAEVADKVIIHYLDLLDSIHLQAEELCNTAVTEYNGNPNWTPYACQFLLNPTRIDHGVLSLYGTLVTYSGSGHPDRVNIALNYDLTTGDPVTLGSIMNKDATVSQFCDLVTAELSNHAEDFYLYDDYADTVALKFSGDESLFESFYFTETGVCFYFDVYEIAPYSSGVINIELPYEKLVGLIHDAYFPAERDLTDGCLYYTPYEDKEAEQYVSMTEAILSDDGIPIIIYTDSSVDSVRIQTSTDDLTHSPYISYAASGLHKSEAIVVTGSEEQLNEMNVSYQNQDGIQYINVVQ